MSKNFNLKTEKMSVFTFSYRKSYYLIHPWVWFKDAYWGIRNLWHRARYGYAFVDAWNMSDATCEMMANMLIHLVEKSCAYPGREPFETPEKWKKHLEEMATRMRRIANRENYIQEQNGYWPEFEKRILYFPKKTLTENEKDLRAKYYAREKELWREIQDYIQETFTMFGKYFEMYWD